MKLDTSLANIITSHPEFIESLDVTFKNSVRDILASVDCWPTAVDPRLIIQKDDDWQIETRAAQILNLYMRNACGGKRFLDFGTGNSRCWRYANQASLSIGYDIDQTTDASHDWEAVLASRPYDVILLYDVVDHVVDITGQIASADGVIELLKVLRDVLSSNGRVYVRCHPWTSRHGTHAYLVTNRAFVHYDTTEYDQELTFKITWPMMHYRMLFESAGFTIVSSEYQTQPVENIFLTNLFDSWKQMFPRHSPIEQIMSINFADFVLAK